MVLPSVADVCCMQTAPVMGPKSTCKLQPVCLGLVRAGGTGAQLHSRRLTRRPCWKDAYWRLADSSQGMTHSNPNQSASLWLGCNTLEVRSWLKNIERAGSTAQDPTASSRSDPSHQHTSLCNTVAHFKHVRPPQPVQVIPGLSCLWHNVMP